MSNIINHGESDIQWQIGIYCSHLSVLGIILWKEKVALNNLALAQLIYVSDGIDTPEQAIHELTSFKIVYGIG